MGSQAAKNCSTHREGVKGVIGHASRILRATDNSPFRPAMTIPGRLLGSRRCCLDPSATVAAMKRAAIALAFAAAGCTSGSNERGGATDASVTDGPSELVDAKMTDVASQAYDGPCIFSADAFDQSCTTDMDCVGVSPSYYCSPAQCGCSVITISRSALPKFNAAVAATPLGSGAVEGVDCGCPAIPDGMCCVNGTCQSVCPQGGG
jgi:hypothetical protein